MSEEIEKELLPFEEEENYQSPEGGEEVIEKIKAGEFGKMASLLASIE